MTRTHLTLVAILLGALAGVGAVAYPRSAAPPLPPRLTVARIAPTPHINPKLALGIDVLPGTRRVAVRAPDPAGGPEWAVETLRGRYALPPGVPRKRVGKELFGLRTCVRLGRVVGGRFGWLDGSGTFRPAGTSTQEAPTRCRRDDDPQPAAYEQTTWVSHPTFGPAVPLAQVAWGPASGAVTVRTHSGVALNVTAASHAFVAFAPAGAAAPKLTVTVTSADGRQSALRPDSQNPHKPGLAAPARLGAHPRTPRAARRTASRSAGSPTAAGATATQAASSTGASDSSTGGSTRSSTRPTLPTNAAPTIQSKRSIRRSPGRDRSPTASASEARRTRGLRLWDASRCGRFRPRRSSPASLARTSGRSASVPPPRLACCGPRGRRTPSSFRSTASFPAAASAST